MICGPPEEVEGSMHPCAKPESWTTIKASIVYIIFFMVSSFKNNAGANFLLLHYFDWIISQLQQPSSWHLCKLPCRLISIDRKPAC